MQKVTDAKMITFLQAMSEQQEIMNDVLKVSTETMQVIGKMHNPFKMASLSNLTLEYIHSRSAEMDRITEVMESARQ